MRRVLMALLGTALGTTLLVGLKATGAPVGGPDVFAEAPFDPSGGTSSPGQPGVFGPSGQPFLTSGPGTSMGPGATAPPGGSSATTSPPSGGGSTTAPPPATRTITGASILVRTARTPNLKASNCAPPGTWGTSKCNYQIQVTIQVAGTQVVAIAASHSPASIGDNGSYYTKAANTLIQRAPTSYPANTAVSGATYSANAYLQSLQSALQQIG